MLIGLVASLVIIVRRRRKVVNVVLTDVCHDCKKSLVRGTTLCDKCDLKDLYACPECGLPPSDCGDGHSCYRV